ncbi:histidine kinase [Kibdelosporangium lantanae]
MPATYRWLLTLLAGAFVIDVVLAVQDWKHGAWAALPGAALMVACAMLGTREPVQGLLGGAVVLLGSTGFIRVTHSTPQSIGINNLLLSEIAAGVVLVVLVVWRARPVAAGGSTALLVVAAVASVFERTAWWTSSSQFRSMQLGLLLLIACVVVGIYLRGSAVRPPQKYSEMGSLVRRQWPLAGALMLVVFVDFNLGSGSRVLALGGAVVACVCAFFAPRAPVVLALTATTGIALAPLIYYVPVPALLQRDPGEPVVLAELAASMALMAFVTRWGRPRQAMLSTAALTAANVVAIWLRSERTTHDRLSELVPYLGFMLLVAVATGLYFRARDRERAQTISVAVTGAQQSERMALARELHDVVAHHVTGIVVQAQAARLVAEKDPRVAVKALERIEATGADALKAMRFMVASMRGAKAAGTSEATEQATYDLGADLDNVVQHFSGPPVTLELDLPEVVPQQVGRSVLRLVQESLTNVGKHALGPKRVQVRVSGTDSELHVRVSDDGVGRRANPVGGSGGYGLIGMRERVELLGGRFSAGPATPGWRVEAWLPVTEAQTKEDK